MASKPYAVVMALRAVDMATKPVGAVRNALKSLRGQAAVTARAMGMNKVVSSFRRVKASLGGIRKSMGRLGPYMRKMFGPLTAMLGAVSIGAMGRLINSSAEAGDALSKLSQRTGMSVEKLQEWEFAARRGGMESTEFNTALRDLTKNVGEAANGTGEGRVVFDALGISLRDSTGAVRDTNDVMLDLADRMEAIPDAATRGAIAQKLFGESGGKMVVALKDGREALADLFEEQRSYGQLTQQQADDAAKFVDRTTNMGEALKGVMNIITANLMPVLGPMIERITQWVQANRELIASQVTDYVRRLAQFLENINWSGVMGGIKGIVDWVLKAKDFFGGWGNTLALFAAVLHADLIFAFLGLAKSLATLGIQAALTAGKIALMGLVGAAQSGMAFFQALQFGVGIMKALNIAVMANPLGLFIAALMAVGTAIYLYFQEPIDQFIANLDIVTPVKKMMSEVAGLMPDWLQDKLGLNVETSVADNSSDSGSVKAVPKTGVPFPAGSAPKGVPPPSAGLMAPAPPNFSPSAMQAMNSQMNGQAQVVVTFANAPAGMRITSSSSSPGLDISTELDYGEGMVGSGL